MITRRASAVWPELSSDVVGLIAGWLSGKITRGAGFGLLGDLFLGLVGGVIGGWVFRQLGIYAYGFIGGLAAATVGAVLLVAIGRLLHSGPAR